MRYRATSPSFALSTSAEPPHDRLGSALPIFTPSQVEMSPQQPPERRWERFNRLPEIATPTAALRSISTPA